jgi:hypothetical protein
MRREFAADIPAHTANSRLSNDRRADWFSPTAMFMVFSCVCATRMIGHRARHLWLWQSLPLFDTMHSLLCVYEGSEAKWA